MMVTDVDGFSDRRYNIALICGFFDSTLQSFRENQFARRLAERGHSVRVFTSDESIRWKWNRAGSPTNDPTANDLEYNNISRLTLDRRKAYFRLGDLVLFRLSKSDLAGFDIVHVLDFRQGITAVAARLAKSIGLPVIYDHEQRGDRVGSLFHIADNRVRKAFIRYGAKAPTIVRHTVRSNREFFERVAPFYKNKFCLSPLGADEQIFYVDTEVRKRRRAQLGLSPSEFMWLMTGKIEVEKRIDQVAFALRKHGKALFIAGDVSERALMDLRGHDNVKLLGKVSQSEVSELYNAADCCIFTTFTLSYWEALACGSKILVPSTKFSDEYLGGRSEVFRFGASEMFSIEEERYRAEIDIAPLIESQIPAVESAKGDRLTPHWLSWGSRIDELEAQYRELIS